MKDIFDYWTKTLIIILIIYFIALYHDRSQIGRYQKFGDLGMIDTKSGNIYLPRIDADDDQIIRINNIGWVIFNPNNLPIKADDVELMKPIK